MFVEQSVWFDVFKQNVAVQMFSKGWGDQTGNTT